MQLPAAASFRADPHLLPTDHHERKLALMEMVAEMDATIAALQASRAATLAVLYAAAEAETRALNGGSDDRFAHGEVLEHQLRSTACEIATLTHLNDRTVERQLDEAATLFREFRHTRDAWAAGEISTAHARLIYDIGSELPDGELREQFDVEALALARTRTPAQFRRVAQRLRAKLDPVTDEVRHEEAAAKRCVRLTPLLDGMSQIEAVLPNVTARAVFDRITQFARERQPASEARDVEAFGPRRADVFAELLINGQLDDSSPASAINGIKARVAITIPALGLLGHEDAPAWLDGESPIPAHIAKTLAGHAHQWLRVVTDPITGIPLAADTYRPTAALRRFIEAGQQCCIAPGCSALAVDCDLDHTHEHARGGATSADNLAPLCRRHHTMRHSHWELRAGANGTRHWRSPSGVRAVVEPEPMTLPVNVTWFRSRQHGTDAVGESSGTSDRSGP